MKIKLDLSKFKLRSRDEHKAVLEHPDGHTFNVAIKALHPENRKNLDSLKMADGGEVKGKQSSGPNLDPDKLKQFQDNSIFNSSGKKKQDSAQPRMYAEGTPDAPVGEEDDTSDSESIPINIESPQVSSALVNPNPGSMQAAPIADNEPQQASVLPTPPAASPTSVPEAGNQQSPNAQVPPPDINNAYQQQMATYPKEAEIIADKAKEEETAFKAKALAEDNLKLSHDEHLKNMMDEVKTLRTAIDTGKINPNHYMGSLSTGGKIATAIGLALGGIGGGTNQALEFVNRQIDRDIDAQKAELGKKETLLSSLSRLYGDQVTGEHMTRAILNDQALAHVQQAEAKSASPMAKNRAQQLAAQFQMQMAGPMQQAALRQTLRGSDSGGAPIQQDPAHFVTALVPPDKQKEVFGQIEAAQNTRHMSNDIVKAFDLATKENTVARTGAGLLRTPASVYSLHQAMQPTFKDLEGTVRQAAMDNTFKNVTPMPGDSQHTIDIKRQALLGYLQSKASAPMAKGFGIDLDKFASTKPMEGGPGGGPEIKTLNGVQYQKVQGGWKRVK